MIDVRREAAICISLGRLFSRYIPQEFTLMLEPGLVFYLDFFSPAQQLRMMQRCCYNAAKTGRT